MIAVRPGVGVVDGGPALWSPATPAGLLAWWRPEALGAYAADASLTSWADASGNGRDATPYTSVKPIVKKALRNGLDAVRFAGTTDVLAFAHTGSLLRAWTVFAALGGLDVTTNTINYLLCPQSAGTSVGGNHATFGFLGVVFDGSNYVEATVKPTTWGVDCFQPANLYRDNVEVSYSGVVGAPPDFNFSDLGGRSDVANLGLKGDLGELLIYRRVLTAAERGQVQAYLKTRWNTP